MYLYNVPMGMKILNTAEKIGIELLAIAGIEVNGKRPWDIRIHHSNFFNRVLSQGSLGMGESYMDKWWDSEKLNEFFDRVFKANLSAKIPRNWKTLIAVQRAKLINLQNKRRARKVAFEHYDLDNDFYMAFLDPYNQYTCGYFKETDNLNTAQVQKLDLICRKLQLKESDRVLDIGCGWGGFAKYAAEHFGCHVTGITISKEQAAYARDFCEGLPVDILECDYRDLRGEFDKVLICGMIEHVGQKNYRTIMEAVYRLMSEDGIFLLHTIGTDVSEVHGDPWLAKYIFPNSMLPSLKQIMTATEGLFKVEDLQNIGVHYEKTLLAWYDNLVTNWGSFSKKYSDRFFRMWEFYFLSCAGNFKARGIQLWQTVLTKKGMIGGYPVVR